MSWITGSATGKINLLDQLLKLAVGNGLTAVAVSSGGTGYDVGDVVRAAGGTVAVTGSEAEMRVTAVSGGVITALVVHEGGSYTSNPSSPNSVTTVTGTGSGASITLTLASNGWTLQRRSQEAVSATVGAGGSGGTNGTQTVTVSGGVGVTTASQFSVTVAGGTITAVLSLVTAGLYEQVPGWPSNPSTVAVTGAGLVGATLAVTWAFPATQEQVAILQGAGGGSDAILIGFRTYTSGSAINWALFGFTAYNAGLIFTAQAGISPGSALTLGEGGAFVPLHNSGGTFPLDYWLSITPNRIIGAVKVRNASVTHYASFYLGFVNRFGSPTEWPYPIYVCGTTSRFDSIFSDTQIARLTGLTDLVQRAGSPGPGWYRRADSTWQDFMNSAGVDGASQSRSIDQMRNVFPSGVGSKVLSTSGGPILADDEIVSDLSGFIMAETVGAARYVIPRTGVPGTESVTLHPTPMTGGALRRLYPATLVLQSDTTEFDIFGELDSVFWVSAADVTTPLTAEDIVTISNQRYRVFRCGNQNFSWTHMAIKES